MLISIASNLLNNNNLFKKHSTFNSTVNFIDDFNNLIAIHPYYIEKSPLAIIVDLEIDEFEKYFKNINYLQIVDDTLYLDSFKFDLNKIKKTNHSLLADTNFDLDYHELLKEIDYIIESNFKNILINGLLEIKINNLIKSFNDEKVKEAISDLIGYGDGLTPSGDDIIAGTLAGLLLSKNNTEFERFKGVVSRELTKNKTTIFSDSFIKHAMEGNFILNVINLVSNQNKKEVLINISNMGHRSGIDYLVGIKIGILKGGKI